VCAGTGSGSGSRAHPGLSNGHIAVERGEIDTNVVILVWCFAGGEYSYVFPYILTSLFFFFFHNDTISCVDFCQYQNIIS
jgi:hypothetical protein